jgi:hypothetical protein
MPINQKDATMKTNARLFLLAGIACALSILNLYAAPVKKAFQPQQPKPTATNEIGLYAEIGLITSNGFTTTKYRFGGYAGYDWRTASVIVEGADVTKLVTGEYWHGIVKDAGVIKGPTEGTQWRKYIVVRELKK